MKKLGKKLSDKKKDIAQKMKGEQSLIPQGKNFGEHNDSDKNIERNRA